ncbi:MAG: hypothetical protein ACJAUZ_003075, partial [Flavobacteriaceae bacterium]
MREEEFDPSKDAQQWDELPTISLKNWLHGTEAEKREVAKAL